VTPLDHGPQREARELEDGREVRLERLPEDVEILLEHIARLHHPVARHEHVDLPEQPDGPLVGVAPRRGIEHVGAQRGDLQTSRAQLAGRILDALAAPHDHDRGARPPEGLRQPAADARAATRDEHAGAREGERIVVALGHRRGR
jgi:hypothetical protein